MASEWCCREAVLDRLECLGTELAYEEVSMLVDQGIDDCLAVEEGRLSDEIVTTSGLLVRQILSGEFGHRQPLVKEGVKGRNQRDSIVGVEPLSIV